MSTKLNGKVAVITASTEGIGLAIAKRLASDGASVVISSRKLKKVTKAVDLLKKMGYQQVYGCRCHIGVAEDRKNLFRETMSIFGRIDIFVSNAAVNPFLGKILDCPQQVWDKIFDINVRAPFLMVKDAVPLIKKSQGGSVVFISSVAAYNPMRKIGAYSVSKTALLGLTKVLSQSLIEDNIRVNCVAPGVVETKSSRTIIAGNKTILEEIPLNRVAAPEEIAAVVSFLVSDDASYVSGETVTVAGGMISHL
ncbi:Dehydrogenase/reductase SDR family member 4 [Pseudolycoriella hygida]|uniref:Dehydrogenase/reductase SDR family member 4 n=1 Tax=Pseudolycoriella hygida TaxID=35572 RepID=A0A9Q0MMY1_9DIPT|nr:Dehydrogenase/reductase SDR family member 4 [Pseudolycoriella hygida]